MDGIKEVLSAGYASSGFSVTLLGALAHITIIRNLFVEEHLTEIFATYAISIVGLGLAFSVIVGLSLLEIILRLTWAATAFNLGLFLSIGIYRASFHPLRQFPGPFLSKITRFYDAYLAGRNIQYHVEIGKLHETYGDFIRTGPRELCIVDATAVPTIYGPTSKCRKSTWYAQVSTKTENVSVHHTRDFDDHRTRRRAWDRGFSIKALASYIPRIQSKTNRFVSHIENSQHQPLDATAWGMFLSFDIMGDVGLGKEFDNLGSGVEHPAIKAVHDHMAIAGVLGHIPWLLHLISRIPGAASGYSSFFEWCGGEIERKWKTWDKNQVPQDLVSWLLKAYMEKDISAPPSREALDQDGRVIVIAGSDTTASTFTSILYFLAKYPRVLQKLQHQLDEVLPTGSEWSYEKIKSLQYIEDIIQETLRLRPPVMTGGYRVTPPEGITVQGRHIPGDTNVFVPVKLIQEDERYYKASKEFVPERWSEQKELRSADAPFFPFSLGPYLCPGKGLAFLSLRVAVSMLAQKYNVKFATGETGEDFETKALDTFTTKLPPLQIQFEPRY